MGIPLRPWRCEHLGRIRTCSIGDEAAREVLPDKALRMLDAIFTQGLPDVPEEPPRPDFR